jgi:hypothetical protein
MNRQEADEALKKLPVKAITLEGEGDLPCRVAFPCVHADIKVVVGMADTWEEAVAEARQHADSLTGKNKKGRKKKPVQPTLFPEED